MGSGNREARNQEMEGRTGGKTTVTGRNKYTGGPLRSKPTPYSAGASSSSHPHPTKPTPPLDSAGAARHPRHTPPPRARPPRSNPKRAASQVDEDEAKKQKPRTAFTTETEKNKWFHDLIDSFRYTGGPIRSKAFPSSAGASSSSHPPPPIKPTSPLDSSGAARHPKLTPPPPSRSNPKRAASHVNGHDNEMEPRPRTTLTAAESRSDAYRRITVDPKWRPPACSIRLLQEDHYSDPWRVLVICMLLNRTSGTQVKRILDDFFELCPNAEVAKDVGDEQLIELITPLGFGVSRTATIKRFSHEYLKCEWTHVTQLHGVGKYAADAYAIFCVGEPEKVRPVDRKLVPYWKCLCKMGVQKEINKSN